MSSHDLPAAAMALWLWFPLLLLLKVVVAIAAGLVFGVGALVLYRLFLHPLAGVPGPRLAAVSNVWHAVHVRNGRMLALAKTLHDRYGPVVRVGPDEVWFNSREAFRDIYRAGSGYEKSDFYLATVLQRPTMDWNLKLHFPDTLDLLSERDKARYRLQRRLIGPVYQGSSVKKYEKAVDDVLARVVVQIRSLDGAEVDLKEWMHIVAVECLGAAVLTWSPGYLQDRTDWGSSAHGYLGWRRKSVFGLFPLMVKAELVSKEVSRAFARLWGLTYKAGKDFKPFFTGVYRVSSRRINVALKPAPESKKKQKPSKPSKHAHNNRDDLLADLVQLHRDKPEFNEMYLRRMATTNFGAGHETLCSTLTAIMSMLGTHADVQTRVAHELTAAPSLSFDNVMELAYTRAAVKESQRFYPVLGMSLSRTVPSGGLHAHGHFFPPGTTVGCNPVALHRNRDIFGADADVFNPDRWASGGNSGEEQLRAMNRYNLIWGGGSRTCPGRHLAYLILYKVVPALVKEFEVQVTMPPEDEIQFYFMAMLTGVKARFVPRSINPEIEPSG